MLISGVYHAIRTSAIFTSLTVGLRGTDRRFILVIFNKFWVVIRGLLLVLTLQDTTNYIRKCP